MWRFKWNLSYWTVLSSVQLVLFSAAQKIVTHDSSFQFNGQFALTHVQYTQTDTIRQNTLTNRTNRATHEYNSFFNPWTETSALHINIPRSLIHEPKQGR